MKRRFLLTAGLALCGAACATVRPWTEAARCDVGATAASVDIPAHLPALVGDFSLFMIDTTVADTGWSSPLHLALPDSAQRAYAATRSLGHYVLRKLQLVGSQKWNPQRPPESAELSDNVLYL